MNLPNYKSESPDKEKDDNSDEQEKKGTLVFFMLVCFSLALTQTSTSGLSLFLPLQ